MLFQLNQVPRFRSQTSLRVEPWTYQHVNQTCTSGLGGVTAGVSNVLVGEYKDMDDWVTPGYGKRSDVGEVINNRMRQHKESHVVSSTPWVRTFKAITECNPPPSKYYSQNLTGPWGLSKLWLGGSVSPRSLVSNEEITAMVSLATNAVWAKSNQHSAMIMVDIAERKKTLQLLRAPLALANKKAEGFYKFARPLVRRISRARKGGKMVANLTKELSEQWLQYRYGIRPLVKSINDTLNSLGRHTSVPHRHTHRSQRVSHASEVYLGTSGDSGTTFDFEVTYTDEVTIRVGGLFEDRLSQAESLGLDAGSLLVSAWELIPFSFVVDWFAGVSSFLEAYSAELSRKPVAGWVITTRVRTVNYRTTSSTGIGLYNVTTPLNERYEGVFTDVSRWNGLPSVQFSTKPGSLASVLADARIVDSAALLTQKLRNIKGLKL